MKAENTFTIIYSFKIKSGNKDAFIESWAAYTRFIYEYEGSFGSRLHQLDATNFIAYAQWPDKETYNNSGNNMPEAAKKVGQQMRDCCEEIKSLYQMQVVKDLLKGKPF